MRADTMLGPSSPCRPSNLPTSFLFILGAPLENIIICLLLLLGLIFCLFAMVHLLMTRYQQRVSEMQEMTDILNGMSSGLLPCYITLVARAKLWQFSKVLILSITQKIACTWWRRCHLYLVALIAGTKLHLLFRHELAPCTLSKHMHRTVDEAL